MLVLLNSLAYGGMQQRLKTTQVMREKNLPQLEVCEMPNYPERRLWTAIILFTVQEYEDTLSLIKKLWTADRVPVSKYYLQQIRTIRHEVRHDWFRHICDLADIDQSHVLKRLKKFDFAYGLAEVEFTAEDNAVTRYQVRKAMAQRERRGTRVNKKHA